MTEVTKITSDPPILNIKGGTNNTGTLPKYTSKNKLVSIGEVNKLYEIFKDLIENFKE